MTRIKLKYTKFKELDQTDVLNKWLETFVGNRNWSSYITFDYVVFSFRYSKDAIMFALRWVN